MRRSPLSGGCLLRGASRPAVLSTFPWVSSRSRYYRCDRLSTTAVAHADRTGDTQPCLALEHVLAELRKAQGIDRLGPNVEAVVSGRGKHLGIAVNWSLRWTAAGSFAEEIRGPQLTFKWGYDGRQDSGCWEVDSSGLVRIMECDDHEAVLMTTYIRTGCWLQPHLQDRFEMELLPTPPIAAIAAAASSSSSSTGSSSSSRTSSPSGAGGEVDVAQSTNGQAEEEAVGRGAGRGQAAESAPAAAARSPGGAGGRKATSTTHGSGGRAPAGTALAADEVVAIGLRVRGRKLRVRVLVRRRDWRLLGFDHRMCADVETWELGEWKEWAEGVQYPSSALHKASNGGQHAYLTSAGAAQHVAPLPLLPDALTAAAAVATVATAGACRSGPPAASLGAASPSLPPPTDFGLPLLPPIPGDTSYSLQGGRGAVPLWRAASGHYLVRPSINGQEGGGYFVLDTGASGFVITPQAAARLGGQSFGETHAASISGKVAARFVRLGSWGLGGVSIRQPVLMVMDLEGLVRGAPGEVVGIVGHDLFRRAVVEVPQLLGAQQPSTATRRPSDPGSGFKSGSDSGSGSEDEHGSAPWEADGGRRDAAAAVTALAAAPSGCYAGSGGSTPPVGPPPPPPRSTPAFGDGAAAVAAAGASSSSRAAAAACAAAPSQTVSVAAAAVPSPSLVLEPAEPSASSTLPGGGDSTDTGSGSSNGTGRSSSSSSIAARAEADSSSSSSSDTCSTTSRTSVGSSPDESSSNSGRSSSSGSSTSSGSGGGVRTSSSGGRSATARAVRRAARTVPYTLHEMVLHHPLEYRNESDWVWEPLVMIANLPHVHLRFADPRVGGSPRSALLMVDSGACGADLMLHARAQKELALGAAAAGAGSGAGGGSRSQGHYLRGVGQDPKDLVQLQVLDLPWLEVAGVRFEQVRCMCAAVGGLDISIYSHGILCGDLLSRLEWAIDYTHKRIGFRRGAAAPAPRAGR
ncbi:hypothetical protein PLESTB_000512800 [Pleodorina starrii]|uniref:Peptidase A2 domain-containing protein n=1 Tax=Pleodorina starrii TaxID=330485 RepID=A0A9W6BGB9_9CHLO|nr:hypothetical protein PLESTB_000512800 [Pleodorina starrii]GLC72299.1 hypothetical protein PLESTF_001232700 [Pleodorina starrii]